MNANQINFVNTLNASMQEYASIESKIEAVRKDKSLKKVYYLILSIYDFIVLFFKLKSFSINKTSLFYSHSCFIKNTQKINFDTLYHNLKPKTNFVYISYDKYNYISKIEGVRVFNIGIFVKLIAKFNYYKKSTHQKDCNIWLPIQNVISKRLNKNTIYIPAYSNGVGLSLVFNTYRKNYSLIEIQHGSVINYPPYSFISNLPLVDVFYYRTENDKHFLEQNLFTNYKVEMREIPKTEIKLLPKTNKIEILYISSYEFNGFHQVFIAYLQTYPKNVYIRIRLHPRQYHVEKLFENEIKKYKVDYEFQLTPNWYDNLPENCIIISPFSSIIEEASNANIKTIIIDSLGKKRFEYLINQKKSIYTANIANSIYF